MIFVIFKKFYEFFSIFPLLFFFVLFSCLSAGRRTQANALTLLDLYKNPNLSFSSPSMYTNPSTSALQQEKKKNPSVLPLCSKSRQAKPAILLLFPASSWPDVSFLLLIPPFRAACFLDSMNIYYCQHLLGDLNSDDTVPIPAHYETCHRSGS